MLWWNSDCDALAPSKRFGTGANESRHGDDRVSQPSQEQSSASPRSSVAWRWRYDIPKRVLDVTVGSVVFVAVLPLLAVAAAIIKVSSPGPVLHKAVRVGRGGQPFSMLKLRTMYVDADHSAQRDFNRRELRGELEDRDEYTIESDPRITSVGRILRRLSIDELPQLVNVLRGEMSLVGPRPSVAWEVVLFDPHFRRREDVLPGITGLWQVSGRRTIDMRGMLELDLVYVDSRSLIGDLVILARTIPAVVNSTGAS
jgi:lipopolysaccharide/colanic/teichoic acid biosynthesis glycosyltransferase